MGISDRENRRRSSFPERNRIAAIGRIPEFLRDTFKKGEVITMKRQTSDQAWQQLQAQIEGLFNQALRKEKETHPESIFDLAGSQRQEEDRVANRTSS